MDAWRIIGIDCAVDPKKVGVAVGELRDGRVVLLDAVQCSTKRSVADAACDFAGDATRVLFALDAPLGWPAALGTALTGHRAGAPIRSIDHTLFRRRTDEVVARETGHAPLDVGANLIARTAVAALADLQRIRDRLRVPIPLAWDIPTDDAIVAIVAIVAIEVYPAGTLQQMGIVPRGYKKAEHVGNRMRIFDAVARVADLGAIRAVAERHADAFDAAVCVLAGADFLLGRCRAPKDGDVALARHEGWIWFRSKE